MQFCKYYLIGKQKHKQKKNEEKKKGFEDVLFNATLNRSISQTWRRHLG